MERRAKALEKNQEVKELGFLGNRGKISWGKGHVRGQEKGGS